MIKRQYALISGIAIIAMAITAGYAYGYVHGELVVANDPTLTTSNLIKAKGLFGSGILGWLIILICDVLVSWNLYRYFQNTNKKVSAITGILRALYSAILAVAIFQLISVWFMLGNTTTDVKKLISLINSFETYWSNGLIVFGLHLIGLGYLVLKASCIPKWMGWLLYLAGLSYTVINTAKMLVPNAITTIAKAEMILSGPMAIAELGLAIWLIWKGGRQRK